MDLLGVMRTIDHAVYMLLNSIAIILWRLNTALISISLYSYGTQDWLTGRNGGVWQVLETLVGADGIFGLATWQAFLLLAIMLFGLARVARPFLPRIQPVDPGKLFLFGILSYVVISQGSSLMQNVESWRSDAGSYMYQELAQGDMVELEIPGATTPGDEPLYAPRELDGEAPLRGWEAVASSYFLVQNAEELHQGVPPRDFRLTYCLYDPNEPIDEQAEENSAGCSPRKAWDEWETISLTQPITQVWGIPLPGSVSIDIPVFQEHPENRQLAIRQAQAGVARLAMGPVVALFPLVEANISLMLALAASFIYLSLPIVLLFGFFLATEAMATRLLLQLINVIIRTLILNGLAALFLMLLMGVSLNGSLTSYLGLVGVGLIGGFLLTRFAAGTMKESFSQALGAVGGIWMGATVGTMGAGAARPARTALGLAKIGASAAMLGAAGGRAFDLAEAGLHSARSGVGDLNQATPETMNRAQRTAGRLPAPLARMAQAELSTPANSSAPQPIQASAPLPGKLLSAAATRTNGRNYKTNAGHNGSITTTPNPIQPVVTGTVASSHQQELEKRYSPSQRQAVQRATQQLAAAPQAERFFQADGRLTTAGVQAVRARLDESTARLFSGEQGAQDLAALATVQSRRADQSAQTSTPITPRQERQAAVDRWLDQSYQAQRQGQGLQQTRETGRELLGEELAPAAERALSRHSQAETRAVLTAARQVQEQEGQVRQLISPDGRLTAAGIKKVGDHLDDQTAQAFSGPQGQRDLAVLTGVAWQTDRTAPPQQFRQAVARAEDQSGEKAAGRTVPRALGLDPVAAGAHFAGLNRFARLSEQAGLSTEQRQQLLTETRQGKVSADLRQELEATLQRRPSGSRGPGLQVDDLVAGAAALPETLTGPGRLRFPAGRVLADEFSQSKTAEQASSAKKPAKKEGSDIADKQATNNGRTGQNRTRVAINNEGQMGKAGDKALSTQEKTGDRP